ncbi:HAD-IIIA family hydrolase [Halobacillus massiliensis]|uniref:HAD-IIIA family hydrolase n=1 Tax=Halobacillus massiliensis TaxID=1926286 RepID=UPI0009E36B5C|nr:HAD-IIIA family hydrolase [Halobacillus massiliensis]
MRKAVFVDRDGTLGGSEEIEYPGSFALYPETKEHIRLLKSNGFFVFSFTNQPGISKGQSTKQAFKNELYGFGMDDVYLCPHSPEEGCACRKPQTGMIDQARKDYHLNLKESWVIGDRFKDIQAANRSGTKSILVLTGAGKEEAVYIENDPKTYKETLIAADLNQAIRKIITCF